VISPSLDNVIFASAEYNFMFNLNTIIAKYRKKFPEIDIEIFKKMLWGDYYFNHERKRFTRKAEIGNKKRAFVEFVL
jgi:U5 small nuclear ribonucleoprotein component